mmetsp:Transcript_4023/g.3800  ORF Transcript_4023/g.3800 Transcript_4023/m.3800 type:complete len:171 (+) Transcript_4023:177-689(+)
MLAVNRGYADNLKKIAGKNTAINFASHEDDFRPVSKESDHRTSTSTPFNQIRNNLNSEGSSVDPQVAEFLEGIKLAKYCTLFIENGIYDLDSVLQLNEDILSTLEIPLGHKLKILKKIKQVKDKRILEEEEKQPIYEDNNILPPRQEPPDYEAMPYDEPKVPEQPVQATS